MTLSPEQWDAARRLRAGESKKSIAHKLGIDRATLWRWEQLQEFKEAVEADPTKQLGSPSDGTKDGPLVGVASGRAIATKAHAAGAGSAVTATLAPVADEDAEAVVKAKRKEELISDLMILHLEDLKRKFSEGDGSTTVVQKLGQTFKIVADERRLSRDRSVKIIQIIESVDELAELMEENTLEAQVEGVEDAEEIEGDDSSPGRAGTDETEA